MPASVKLQQEYGDDLAVLFVESQGTAPDATEKFVLEHKWFGNPAMWTTERPFNTGSKGLPNFALLSADGKVLAKGNFVSKKVRELIDEEIKLGKQGPEDTPKKLQKAWKTFGKGKVAKAIEEAKKAGADPELSAEAELTVLEFEKRIGARLDRVEWLLANGYAARATDHLDDLVKELKGTGELFDRAAELQVSLEDEEQAREIEAAAAIEKHLAKLFDDPKNEKHFKKLSKLAESYAGTAAAERAQHIASLGR